MATSQRKDPNPSLPRAPSQIGHQRSLWPSAPILPSNLGPQLLQGKRTVFCHCRTQRVSKMPHWGNDLVLTDSLGCLLRCRSALWDPGWQRQVQYFLRISNKPLRAQPRKLLGEINMKLKDIINLPVQDTTHYRLH